MFTTYSASAGSGKTTNLVADFLALCFRSDSLDFQNPNRTLHLDLFQKILAITFTNNAAGEMKARIVRTLTTFAFNSKYTFDSSTKAIYNKIITKLFGENPPDAQATASFMRTESKELLRRILYDYARFSISTIDSFFQRVIRSSAISLNLNLNYSVQIDMEEFYLQAIDQILNELSAQTSLALRIVALLENNMADTGNLNIDKELRTALDILYGNAEKNYNYLKILRNSDSNELLKRNKALRAWVKKVPEELSTRIKPIALEGNTWMAKLAESGIKFHFPTFSKWFDSIVENPIENYRDSIAEFKNKDDSYFKKSNFKPSEQQCIDEAIPHIEDCFNRIHDIIQPYVLKYKNSLIQLKHADKLSILTDLQAKMESIKIQNNFFILNESNTLIWETIQKRGFEVLFERTKFENFFIDEFQDTSAMQWGDLKPVIINNALSAGHDVFLFGDVKQAIYRFRNGDADLFYKLTDLNRLHEDPELNLITEQTYNPVTLEDNFRSLSSIILFNNHFFDFYSHGKNLQKYYSEGLFQKVKKKSPGLVQIFIDDAKKDKNIHYSQYKKQAAFLKTLQDDKEITYMEMEVLLAVQDALNRGYAEGDIAVLYSGNDKCTRISNLMLKQGWRVITDNALSLNTSPEVNLIIFTLQYLLRPNDILSQSTILYYLSKLKNYDHCLDKTFLTLTSETNFPELLKETFDLTIPREAWLAKPFWILIQDIIRFYELDRKGNPFVISFENLVLQYLKNKKGTIPAFLSWWQQVNDTKNKPSVTLSGRQNAITVSTIHKSKGLEYPVVIVPYTDSGQLLQPVWTKVAEDEVAYIELSESGCKNSSYEEKYRVEKQSHDMDKLNLLYVAHTRAGEMLYIITKRSANGGSGYGDFLHTFIQNHQSSPASEEDIQFITDSDDVRFHYAGDLHWTKPDNGAKESSLPGTFVPHMTVTDFSLEKTGFKAADTSAEGDARAEGTFVHDFLAKLTRFPSTMEEVEELLTDVEPERQPRLRIAFQHILEDESLRPCFAPDADARNEVSILDLQGKEHRPDRVVFLPDKVMVIDYKTGQFHDSYQKQIDEYCTLLREMGYSPVEGKLLFV